MQPINWTAVITACPRPEPTIHLTAQALAAAGWPKCMVSWDRDKQLGPWPNLLAACKYACRNAAKHKQSCPDTKNLVLLIQDDCTLAANLRHYLETHLPHGVVSLWLPAIHDDNASKQGNSFWQHRIRSNAAVGCYGALAYAMPASIANQLHRWGQQQSSGRTRAEMQIGRFCYQTGIGYWYPKRSLCQHVGHQSAIDHDVDGLNLEYRFASNWVRDCHER